MNLSDRLKQVMESHNITQEQLAKLTKISQVSIQKILAGQTRDPKFILEIGQALDVDPYWLKFGKIGPAFTRQVAESNSDYIADPTHRFKHEVDLLVKSDELTPDDIDFLKTAARHIAAIRRGNEK